MVSQKNQMDSGWYAGGAVFKLLLQFHFPDDAREKGRLTKTGPLRK
jgi:hypothetical protein